MSEYQDSLNHNFITRWVHSLRYQKVINIAIKNIPRSSSNIPLKILDIGAADCKLFEVLNNKFNIDYTAIEPAEHFNKYAIEKYGNNSNFRTLQKNAADREAYKLITNEPDIVVCLETFEHMDLFTRWKTIELIRQINPFLFVCSVPIEIGLSVGIKNLASFILRYSRHKNYTLAETFWAMIKRLDRLPPHREEHKSFDYRKLRILLENSFKHVYSQTLPFNLPECISNSIFFMASNTNYTWRK